MDAAERKEILSVDGPLGDGSRRSRPGAEHRASAEVIPFAAPLQSSSRSRRHARSRCSSRSRDGLVNREIGQRLFLSEETVKSHVRHLLAKLQARSRAHAVSIGFRRGLIG